MKNQIAFIVCFLFSTTIFAQSGNLAANLMDENIKDLVAFSSSKKTHTDNTKPKTTNEKDVVKLTYEEKINTTFSVYPNPAHHWVVINTEKLGLGEFSYTIKTSKGEVVETKTMTKSSTTINLQEFEKGVYFITLNEKDGQVKWVQKITVI